MAYATELTIGTGNKVSLNYQSQEVSVSLTYQLEREDTDVLAVVQEKSEEVAKAHNAAWRQLRDTKVKEAKAGKESKTGLVAETAQDALSSEAAQPPAPVPDSSPSPDEDAEIAETEEVATTGQQAALRALLSHIGWSEEQVNQHLSTHFSGASIEHLSQRQAAGWLLELQRTEREKARQRRLHPARLNGKP